MPSHKTRSKEDTWKAEELEESMKEIKRQKNRGHTEERNRRHEMRPDTNEERHLPGEKKKDRTTRDHINTKNKERPSETLHDDVDRGDRNVRDRHRGDKNEGDRHRGDKNEGDKHRGDQNEGDRHRGDKNEGDRHRDKNEGDRHRGDKNEGDRHRGDNNERDKHKGDKNEGDRRRGDKNEGDRHKGDNNERDRQKVDKHSNDGKRREDRHSGKTKQPDGGQYDRDNRMLEERRHHKNEVKNPDDRKSHKGERTNEGEKRRKSEKLNDRYDENRRGSEIKNSGERSVENGEHEKRRRHTESGEQHKLSSETRNKSRDDKRLNKEDKGRRHHDDREGGKRYHGDDQDKLSSQNDRRYERETVKKAVRCPISVKSVTKRPLKGKTTVPPKPGKNRKPEQNSEQIGHRPLSKEDHVAPSVSQPSHKQPQYQEIENGAHGEITHAEGGEDTDPEYEDDFEDYDDDFEDEDDDNGNDNDDNDDVDIKDYPITQQNKEGSAMDEILNALDIVNDRLTNSSLHTYSQSADTPESPRGRSVINFLSASEKIYHNKMASKSMRRARDLLAMIELDVADFDMLDLPPVNEYDLYIRSFGRSNTQQSYVQTKDDNTDRDTETDTIEERNSWSQHPPDSVTASYTDNVTSVAEFEVEGHQQFTATDTKRFSHFVQTAGHVMLVILEEELANQNLRSSQSNQSNISISKGFVRLGQIPFLQGRDVLLAKFCPSIPHLVLTIHGCVKTTSGQSTPAVICVWNTNEPSFPQKYLLCQSTPLTCCFSPAPSNLVFAGYPDGSVALWDLLEPAFSHQSFITGNKEDIILRRHTYNTAGVLQGDNHAGSVINVTVSQSISPDADSKSSNSFQLISVDEFGTINFWVVGELSVSSESDLGLSPGGRVKLIKMSSLSVDKSLRCSDTLAPLTLTCFTPDPGSNNQFLAGTDTGAVVRCFRFGKQNTPRYYNASPESPVEVTCIDLSPFMQPCFLAGYKDGSVRLYNNSTETPVADWSFLTTGHGIMSVRWSPSRPAVFYVLDDRSTLYVYDLTGIDRDPALIETFQDGKVKHIDFSTELRSTDHHRHRPQMMVTREDGGIEVHELDNKVCEMQTLEGEYLENYIQRY